MQTPDALVRVAAECAEDLAADGVVYAEVRFAPELHVERGLSLEAVVEAVLEGFRQGTARRPGRRQADPGRLPAHRDAARRPVAGDRRAGRALPRRRAWSASTSRAPRPASRPPATSTRSSTSASRTRTSPSTPARRSGCRRSGRRIQWCGADRLGHGVRIVDDITLDERRQRRARPARRVRARQAHPAGDVPDVERAHRRRHLDRRSPDRAARRAALPGHGQHRQPADVRTAR